jgi:outer membrane protein TolC
MLYKMNRLPFLVILMLFLCSRTQAQQTRTNKPKTTGAQPVTSPTTVQPAAPPPSSQTTGLSRFLLEDEDTTIENRLVALALNGPEYDASTHQTRINELDLKKTKQTWLNLLTLSSTYNDQSFKNPGTGPGQPTYVYPKYFFGITIPLGIIFSQGTSVKQARESLAYGKDQQEQLARRIRADVLTKYRQYKYYAGQVELQAELINDVLANSSQAEDNFKKGAISVETYIATQRAANDEISRNMNLKLQQDMMRIDIERMIGIPLEEVIRKPVTRTSSSLYH